MGQADTHTVCGIGAYGNRASFSLQYAPQFITARPHHGGYVNARRQQIARGSRPQCDAIKHMCQLAATKARTRAGSKQ